MRVEESSQVACFILCRFFLQRGGFLHFADAPVGMTSLGGVVPFTHAGYFCNVPRNGTQAVPYVFAGRWILSATRVVFGTWYGDGSSPLHCVIPFNHTGCIRNVAWYRFGQCFSSTYILRFFYPSGVSGFTWGQYDASRKQEIQNNEKS